MQYIPAEPAPYSWLRKACKFRITKAGVKALAKVEAVRFIERTDWRDLRYGHGGYFTLDEIVTAEGPVTLELRSFSNNVFVVKYDGKHVTF